MTDSGGREGDQDMSGTGENETQTMTMVELEQKVLALEENQRKLLHWIGVLAMQDWTSFMATNVKGDNTDPEWHKANPGFDIVPIISANLNRTVHQLTEMLRREGIDIEVSDSVFL